MVSCCLREEKKKSINLFQLVVHAREIVEENEPGERKNC